MILEFLFFNIVGCDVVCPLFNFMDLHTLCCMQYKETEESISCTGYD